MCNNGCSWIFITILLLLCCGGCGNGFNSIGNDCGCGNGCNNGCC